MALAIALVVPAVAVVASWCVQYVARFPPRTPGGVATAVTFILASAAEAIPVVVAITRLVRVPSLRRWINYLLTALGAVALLPACVACAALSIGL